jgi:hypothetical protein
MISRATPLDRYFESAAPEFFYRHLLTPEWAPPADPGFLAQMLSHCLLGDGADVLTEALYFDTACRLTGDMLVKVDRMSMANSLECDARCSTIAWLNSPPVFLTVGS